MCLLVVHVGFAEGVPLLLAANREEAYARPSRAPEFFVDTPPVLCGSDALQGGTWLGVNAAALTVAVTNRKTQRNVAEPRSRGLLCRDLLRCHSAEEAADLAERELQSGNYLGANYLTADADGAYVVHGGDNIEKRQLTTGLHLLTNADLDDANDPRQSKARKMFDDAGYRSAKQFIATAKAVCAHFNEPTDNVPENADDVSIIIRKQDRGTVSSTIITLGEKADDCRYLYSPGPPDRADYIELSNSLRWLLGKRDAPPGAGESP